MIKRISLSYFLLSLAMGMGLSTASRAAIVHESASMGAIVAGGGVIINSSTFYGSRFSLTSPTQITAIGGHLIGTGQMLATIIALDNATALPSFSTNDLAANAIASTVFDLPNPSQDVRVPLLTLLNAGWYALIFGGDQSATAGSGNLPTNGTDTAIASYFGNNGTAWIAGTINNPRFIVEGYTVSAVPLPAALPLFGTGLAVLGFAGWRKRRRRVAI